MGDLAIHPCLLQTFHSSEKIWKDLERGFTDYMASSVLHGLMPFCLFHQLDYIFQTKARKTVGDFCLHSLSGNDNLDVRTIFVSVFPL